MAEACITPTMRCTKCAEDKPATPEFFQPQNAREGRLNPACKRCNQDRQNAWRRARYQPKTPKGMTADGLRVCNHCGIAKDPIRENFAPTPRGRFGLHATCRPCLRSMERRRLGIPDDPLLGGWIHQGRRRCPKCREVKPATDGHFGTSRNSRTGLRAHCKECRASEQSLRRARVRSAPGHFSASDIKLMLAGQRKSCWWCGCKLGRYHIDHRIPLSRGGSNGPENLVLACPSCNLRKHTKMPWEMDVPRLL